MDDIEFQKVLARHIFGNPDEAAIHALSRISERDYELGGGIYGDSAGRYSYSDPQGNQKTRTFEARVPWTTPDGKLVGMYHTHPTDGIGDTDNKYFSPHDVAVADQLRLMSYIKSLRSGDVRKYEPGVTKTISRRVPGRGMESERYSKGELMRDPSDIARGK